MLTKPYLNRKQVKRQPQRGISLVMVMIVLTIVSLLGIAGIQISSQGERSARNDRDLQIAWQSAEAALLDAQTDIKGTGTVVSPARQLIFIEPSDSLFVDGCGISGIANAGLCKLNMTGKPAWLAVDFTDTSNAARTTMYGAETGRTFAAGAAGLQPSQSPRYVIEPLEDRVANRDLSSPTVTIMYRITAMGFGPRAHIQAVLQEVFRP